MVVPRMWELISTTESISHVGARFCSSWPHDSLTIEKKLLGEPTGGYSSAFLSLKLITAP